MFFFNLNVFVKKNWETEKIVLWFMTGNKKTRRRQKVIESLSFVFLNGSILSALFEKW